jgi:hypothetical protein
MLAAVASESTPKKMTPRDMRKLLLRNLFDRQHSRLLDKHPRSWPTRDPMVRL